MLHLSMITNCKSQLPKEIKYLLGIFLFFFFVLLSVPTERSVPISTRLSPHPAAELCKLFFLGYCLGSPIRGLVLAPTDEQLQFGITFQSAEAKWF